MIKGFRQITLLTAISRVFGMLRDMAFAYFLGATGLMDGWVIAFMIPNLARRLFGEGAASSSLIPVYSQQLRTDRAKANRLACTVVTAIVVLLLAVTLFGETVIWLYYKFFSIYKGTNLKLALTAVMMPYMVLVCVVAILGGILNAHRHFASPAAAPIVLNVFIIGSLCFSGLALTLQPERQVFVVATAVILAGLVQIIIQLVPLRAKGIYIRPAWQVRSEAFKKIVLLMGPMVLGLTATQINTLADHLIALWLSGSDEKGQFILWLGGRIKYPVWEGAVSHLFYSQRLYQFPLGVLGISLATAVFPVMSSEAARGDIEALCKTIARALRSAVFIALPATAGLLLVARPLVSAIFQRGQFAGSDTLLTGRVLWFYALGLCGFFAQQVVTRAFYSVQDSKMPANSAIIAVISNLVLNLTLIWFMGTAGLALSTAICSYLQVTILLRALRKRLNRSFMAGFAATFAKTLLATFFMWLVGTAILELMKNLPAGTRFEVLRLAAVVPAGCIVYLLAAKFLRIEALGLLTGGIKNTDTDRPPATDA